MSTTSHPQSVKTSVSRNAKLNLQQQPLVSKRDQAKGIQRHASANWKQPANAATTFLPEHFNTKAHTNKINKSHLAKCRNPPTTGKLPVTKWLSNAKTSTLDSTRANRSQHTKSGSRNVGELRLCLALKKHLRGNWRSTPRVAANTKTT